VGNEGPVAPPVLVLETHFNQVLYHHIVIRVYHCGMSSLMATQMGTRFTGPGLKQHCHRCGVCHFEEGEKPIYPEDDFFERHGLIRFLKIEYGDCVLKWVRLKPDDNPTYLAALRWTSEEPTWVVLSVAASFMHLVDGYTDINGAEGGGYQLQFTSEDFQYLQNVQISHEEYVREATEEELLAWIEDRETCEITRVSRRQCTPLNGEFRFRSLW
jgi:hypothetical protein